MIADERLGEPQRTAADRITAHVTAHIMPDGSVIIPPRVASWIKRQLGPALDRRNLMRGTDHEAYAALTALYLSALGYRSDALGSDCGTKVAVRHQDSQSSGEWLTTAEAAQLVGITDRAIRKRIDKQQLPARRHGRQYLVSRQHLNIVSALSA